MISIQALQERLPARFAHSRIVNDELLRCEELDKAGAPFALHYFTTAPNLSTLAENLRDFQNERLGNDYFSSDGDLRWNHYLYVISDESLFSDQKSREAKTLIEGDRSFARKFVLTESQLFESFQQQEKAILDPQQSTSSDVMSRWVERLVSESLDIVLEQKPLAETVRRISEGNTSPKSKDPKSSPSSGSDFHSPGFLERLEIKRFRTYPQPNVFENLGQVNLIYGANGTGKTTLLEAIEYLYCQDNARISPKRSADVMGAVRGSYGLKDISSNASAGELKSRNLRWYGVRDLKGSSLANSFARYNFISTDEAVQIGLGQGSGQDIEELISRLVAGPQAADLWGHIVRLKDPLSAEITRQANRLGRFFAEKKTAEEQLANSAASPSSADHAFSTLIEDLRRLGWPTTPLRDQVDPELLPVLKRWESSLRDLLASEWIKGAPTSASIASYRSDVAALSTRIASLIVQNDSLKKDVVSSEHSLVTKRSNLSVLLDLQAVVASGLPQVIQQIAVVEKQLSEDRQILAISAAPLTSQMPWVSGVPSIQGQFSATSDAVSQIGRAITDLDAELNRLRSNRASVELWHSDIRQLAIKLFNHDHNLDHCPVCNTLFDPVELLRRIEEAPMASSTTSLESLSEKLDGLRRELAVAAEKKLGLEALIRHAGARGIDIDGPASVIINDLSTIEAKIISSEHELETLHRQLTSLEDAGFSRGRLLDIREKVSAIGMNASDPNALDEQKHSLEQQINLLVDSLKSLRSQIEAIESSIFSEAASYTFASPDMTAEKVASVIDQRLISIESALRQLDPIQLKLALPQDANMVLVHEHLVSTVLSLEKFIAADANNKRLGGLEQDAKDRINISSNSIVDCEKILGKLRSAHAVIADLISNYSLQGATEKELEVTRDLSQAIFASVHSPREYDVHRGLETPLMRSTTKELVSLKEVSSGQRAAFVLSLFLSMNAQLRTAPQLILFDDPVAHIDDLNALSFLDHLRHLVLTGRRQIFYATADNRLAGLFEHKFGFLGSKFKRINLSRDELEGGTA